MSDSASGKTSQGVVEQELAGSDDGSGDGTNPQVVVDHQHATSDAISGDGVTAHVALNPPQAAAGPGPAGAVVPERSNKTRSRLVQIAGVLALLVLAAVLWHFLAGKQKAAPANPRGEVVPVEAATVTQQDIPMQINGIGNVEALSTVSIRSQVEGTLQTVHFVPGQEVRKGALLFSLDPRPFQATLSQAEANYAKALAAVKQAQDIVLKDQATARNARVVAERDVKLVEAGVISREEYDNAITTAQAAEAAVRADQSAVNNAQAAAKAEQANVESAKIQLGYTRIAAPIDGKTGNLVVTTGNLVRANDTTAMMTITQTTPTYVTFSVPESELPRIRMNQASKDFRVESFIPGDPNAEQGKLSLIDNTVDPSTGTIKLKGTFLNGDRRLFPGQFVNVVLTLGTQHNAIVVPSQAVQIGQDNTFVYVIKPDMTVEVRNVQPGSTMGNLMVINEGLRPGEQVVTDGQLRLVPGSKVQLKSGQGGRNAGTGGGNADGSGGAATGSSSGGAAGLGPSSVPGPAGNPAGAGNSGGGGNAGSGANPGAGGNPGPGGNPSAVGGGNPGAAGTTGTSGGNAGTGGAATGGGAGGTGAGAGGAGAH